MDLPKEKPLHVKPTFYSYCYESLKEIAKEYGYNLVLHGSMNRDLDLIAIPWVDEPKDEVDMLIAFQEYLCGFKTINATKDTFCFSVLPGGRNSYVISMNRVGKWNNYIDEQYYVDISITPLIKKAAHC